MRIAVLSVMQSKHSSNYLFRPLKITLEG